MNYWITAVSSLRSDPKYIEKLYTYDASNSLEECVLILQRWSEDHFILSVNIRIDSLDLFNYTLVGSLGTNLTDKDDIFKLDRECSRLVRVLSDSAIELKDILDKSLSIDNIIAFNLHFLRKLQ